MVSYLVIVLTAVYACAKYGLLYGLTARRFGAVALPIGAAVLGVVLRPGAPTVAAALLSAVPLLLPQATWLLSAYSALAGGRLMLASGNDSEAFVAFGVAAACGIVQVV